jgi:hypothetical protein
LKWVRLVIFCFGAMNQMSTRIDTNGHELRQSETGGASLALPSVGIRSEQLLVGARELELVLSSRWCICRRTENDIVETGPPSLHFGATSRMPVLRFRSSVRLLSAFIAQRMTDFAYAEKLTVIF